MSKRKINYISLRISIVRIFFVLLLIVIGIKVICLQVVSSPWLSRKAASEYEKSLVVQGPRGTIFDSTIRKMAVTVDVDSIGAFPRQLKDKSKTARELARALKIDRHRLKRVLSAKAPFVWIRRHASPKEVKEVRALQIDGIDFVPEKSRFYPQKTLASQVIGFAGIDGHGLEGVEYFYNLQLQGKTKSYTILKDALGRGFDTPLARFPEYFGENIILTIDGAIQYNAEKALSEAVIKHKAKSGIAIAMIPSTGAIKALAHYPLFNPNRYSSYKRDKWRNRAITDPFEPGSTMKIFTAAAAVESGTSSPSSIFFCENGAYRIGRNTIHDTHEHGWLSLQQIIKYSSNIGAVKVSELIGRKALYNTLRNFGFSRKTGIDCPGESAGSLAPYKRWTRIDTGTIAFGQGIAVSALQLITATAAIANRGVLMKPYIVQAITDVNGRLVKQFNPQKIRRAVSPETARAVVSMLKTVTTEGGTGVNAAIDKYSVCGKTGTAQKINAQGRYDNHRYVSSFVGFAPADDPKIVVLVVLDEPRKSHYGGTVAAPAFRKITKQAIYHISLKANLDRRKLGTAIRSQVTG